MWWLSFASEVGNLGIVLVDAATSLDDAIRQAARAGANPGGECMGIEFSPDSDEHGFKQSGELAGLKSLPRLTLLQAEAIAQTVALVRTGDLTSKRRAVIDEHARVMCEHCNPMGKVPS